MLSAGYFSKKRESQSDHNKRLPLYKVLMGESCSPTIGHNASIEM
jgi:hypothetical protein